MLVGGVAAAVFAGALAACAAIAGLGPYSSENCGDQGCDASVHPKPGDEHVETDDMGMVGDDAAPPPGDDGSMVDAGGCATELIACDAGCADPTSASSCGSCDNPCTGDAGLCSPDDAGSFGCVATCPASAPTACGSRCTDITSDPDNCGACGMVCGVGQTCVGSTCTGSTATDGGVPCPDGGCPTSTATGFSSCPFGKCNSASGACTAAGGCFCAKDTDCKSNKCVKVARENDISCGTNCTGSGSRDGFNCQLASPGIPSLGSSATYACPPSSGFKNSTLACDSSHTNCYCTADSQCPSGKCVPGANNNNCSGCTGTGTADYRGCQATTVIGGCPIYIGCPANTQCQYPICYCNNDVACESGKCIPSGHNGNCSNCTGTGADDGHGCMPAPSSVACNAMGGTSCVTTLTPTPVLNTAKTACLCVADSNCSSGKCINKDSQCTGTCTGTGTADSEDCQTAASAANAWSCSIGNCNNVSSVSGACTAEGVPCWCTSDSQCPSGTQCSSWTGCAASACTGSGAGNSFHCVE